MAFDGCPHIIVTGGLTSLGPEVGNARVVP